MDRYRSFDRLDNTICPLFVPGSATRANYKFETPDDIPSGPQSCPYKRGAVACRALVQFNGVQAGGMEHIANIQLADSNQRCLAAPTAAQYGNVGQLLGELDGR